jgi:hypothetical protein
MEPYRKTILCLANSRRPGGTCFAGKEFAAGASSAWLRPINSAHHGAITSRDRLYTDGSHAELLDIVTVSLLEPKPNLHHQEDNQIKSDVYWKKIGRANWQNVVKATDTVAGDLWVNDDSSYHGVNDKVSAASAAKLKGSLYLIEPTDLDLVVGKESVYGGGEVRRVRAQFTYNKIPYNFVVTDEPVETDYFAKDDGTYRIKDVRLCVSLAEVLNGNATKLVAAVITPDRV